MSVDYTAWFKAQLLTKGLGVQCLGCGVGSSRVYGGLKVGDTDPLPEVAFLSDAPFHCSHEELDKLLPMKSEAIESFLPARFKYVPMHECNSQCLPQPYL